MKDDGGTNDCVLVFLSSVSSLIHPSFRYLRPIEVQSVLDHFWKVIKTIVKRKYQNICTDATKYIDLLAAAPSRYERFKPYSGDETWKPAFFKETMNHLFSIRTYDTKDYNKLDEIESVCTTWSSEPPNNMAGESLRDSVSKEEWMRSILETTPPSSPFLSHHTYDLHEINDLELLWRGQVGCEKNDSIPLLTGINLDPARYSWVTRRSRTPAKRSDSHLSEDQVGQIKYRRTVEPECAYLDIIVTSRDRSSVCGRPSTDNNATQAWLTRRKMQWRGYRFLLQVSSASNPHFFMLLQFLLSI